MKDNLTAIILSVVIIFLLGTLGFAFALGQGVNVNVASNPSNNAEGNPQVSNPVSNPDSGQTIGMAQSPDIVILKLIDYDDITTNGIQIFATSTGGFYLDNLIMETASSTIASGTAFQVYTLGETYGNSQTVFSTQVSNFPKNTTMDLNTVISSSGIGSGYASSTQRVALDDQSALYVKCTGAPCKPSTNRTSESSANGDTYGYVKFTGIFKRVDSSSSIYE